ncbi:SIMPL domain-containing protein [Oceanicella sp. SM1341]|uniref:SIMPL domain-containing protein n=1 Tax=Oceanicella sp. SM1341 TaxID=1548889 RepID=UPI000E4717B0|nr:SIMPL domain-containing protein [Oceanicella sp. SM1341]
MRILIPALTGIVLGLAPLSGLAQEAPPTISVTGEGEAVLVPDLAFVTLGVTTEGETAEAALTANSEAMTRVFDLLTQQGVAERDTQTSQFSLNPVWADRQDGGEARITGYRASNMVTIRVREIEALGGLLDGLTRQGANSIQGISFSASDMTEAMEKARRAAVEDAKARAALYADASGVALGGVRSISEQGGGGNVPMYRMSAAEAAPVPLARGETTVSASVSMVFEIAPAPGEAQPE